MTGRNGTLALANLSGATGFETAATIGSKYGNTKMPNGSICN